MAQVTEQKRKPAQALNQLNGDRLGRGSIQPSARVDADALVIDRFRQSVKWVSQL